MKYIYVLIALLSCASTHTKTKRIAVIDTGIHRTAWLNKDRYGLCGTGHKDFTGKGIIDANGHGTNISSLIHEQARKARYCQVILKYYHNDKTRGKLSDFVNALRHAIKLKVDVINISLGGYGSDKFEKKLIAYALKKGIKIVAAAGNDNRNIDKIPFYPAAYDKRIVVVGNKGHKKSNYGKKVDYFAKGINRKGIYPFAKYMTGTSQATAVVSGIIIRRLAGG